MMNLTCCVACGVGGSPTEKDVPSQVEKFGEYICVRCEESLNSIIETDAETFIDKGYGAPRKALITKDHIYYFDGPIVADPKRSFLGFGGRWYIVVLKKKTEFGFNQEILVTNNLWSNRRIPKGYQRRLEESGAINAVVTSVSKESLENFKDDLNQNRYIKGRAEIDS